MQALPPPPAPVQCVTPEHAKDIWEFIVLSGSALQLDAAISELGRDWLLEAKAESNGVAFARLRHSGDIKYKDLGAMIIRVQQRGLAVSFFTDPPICVLDDDSK